MRRALPALVPMMLVAGCTETHWSVLPFPIPVETAGAGQDRDIGGRLDALLVTLALAQFGILLHGVLAFGSVPRGISLVEGLVSVFLACTNFQCIAHNFIEFRNTLPSAGAPTNTGTAIR